MNNTTRWLLYGALAVFFLFAVNATATGDPGTGFWHAMGDQGMHGQGGMHGGSGGMHGDHEPMHAEHQAMHEECHQEGSGGPGGNQTAGMRLSSPLPF